MAVSIAFCVAIGMCAILTGRTQADSHGSGEVCPIFWTPFGDTCYRLIAKAETWADAEANCQQLGNGILPVMEGHLASIHNQDESDFVQEYYESSYVSSAIVQGRREKTEPNIYNALWLGLKNRANEGRDFDAFVWTDKTEISTNFWLDGDSGDNCGHMWTWPLNYEGKWDNANCTTKLPYVCKLSPTMNVPTQYDESAVPISTSAPVQENFPVFSKDLVCSHLGTILFQGDTLMERDSVYKYKCRNCVCEDKSMLHCKHSCKKVKPHELTCRYRDTTLEYRGTLITDECEVCTCVVPGINSTVSCEVESCPPISCDEGKDPVKLGGNCCEVCPDARPCSYRGNRHFHGDQVILDDCTKCTCDNGTNMCIIMNCPALHCDNGAAPISVEGECCEVCPVNDEELSCLYNGTILNHGDTMIQDCTNCTCDNSTVRCSTETCPLIDCDDGQTIRYEDECCEVCLDGTETISTSCRFHGNTLSDGETLKLDKCTTCTCNDKIVTCDIKTCQPTFCTNVIDIDGECCGVCPYDVPIYDVQLFGVNSVKAGIGTRSNIIVGLNLLLNDNGQSVRGSGLWKVSMWASQNADGSGTKVGFVEQVLTDAQASRNIQKPDSTLSDGFQFSIPDIKLVLYASGNHSCEEVRYVCASFNKGDAPQTPLATVPFNVYGVESRNDSSPNPSKLVGCQAINNCRDIITSTKTIYG